MLRCIFDCIATGSIILGVAGIAGVIEFGTSPVPCVIAIAAGVGAGMLSNWIGKTWYIGEKRCHKNNSPETLERHGAIRE